MNKLMVSVLIFMSTVILTLTITFIKREDMRNDNNKLLLLLGIFALFWCGGYTGLELSGSEEMARLFRQIGLMGAHGYVSIEAYFAYIQTRAGEKNRGLVITCLLVPSVIIAMLLSMPHVVEFVPSKFGYRYVTEFSTIRMLQIIYIVLIFFFSLFMAYQWWKEQPLKRIRRVIVAIVLSECLKIVGAIFDTFLPMRGYESLPGTAIAVFLSFVFMRQLTSTYNTFNISLSNLSKYIYENVNSTVIVLDVHGNIELMNDYGKNYFRIDRMNDLHMDDLFELTKEDAKQLIYDITEENDIHEKMESRLIKNNGINICMVNFTPIKDKYNEVYCIIGFVRDITKTSNAINELQELKQNLEKEVDKKSKEIEEVSLHSISTIANIVDNRDPYVSGHSYRVAEYSAMIASVLEWDEERIENLKYIALLHNIGMIALSETILNKREALTKEERLQIKMHPVIGRDILKDVKTVKGASIATYYHHERYDGLGYPEGIKGREIPIISRIIAVADAYDAMSHDRIYRKRLSDDLIILELEKGSGTQFDPEIVTVMLHLITEKSIYQVTSKISAFDTVENESAKLLQRIMNNVNKQNRLNNGRDYLTNVWDRRGGEQRIVKAMQSQGGCLMIIDIDNFKKINDKYGHLIGDHVLKEVAGVLQSHSDGAIIMRMGGDEFILFMKDIHSKEEAKIVIDGIFRSLRKKMEADESDLDVSLSVGICFCTPKSDYQKKLDDADRALYRVKQNGKNGYMFYSKADMS